MGQTHVPGTCKAGRQEAACWLQPASLHGKIAFRGPNSSCNFRLAAPASPFSTHDASQCNIFLHSSRISTASRLYTALPKPSVLYNLALLLAATC
jgi:hypothetical protein